MEWANPDRARENSRRSVTRYAARHPERRKESSRRWAANHPDRVVRRWRRFYEANRERLLAYARERARADPRRAATKAARRARRIKAVVGELDAILALYEKARTADDFVCHWCKCQVPKGGRRRHLDHLVPLTRGGKHCASNLVFSCASCNSSKGAKLPEEFLEFRRLMKEAGLTPARQTPQSTKIPISK